MTAAQLALLLTAQLVALASPGPALISMMQKAIADGRPLALRFGVGLAIGATSWALAALLGLAVLIQSHPRLMVALQAAGAVFLICLAWKIWRGADDPVDETAPARKGGFFAGMAVNLTNPKPLLFLTAVFLSIFPAPLSAGEGAVVYVLMTAVEIAFYLAVALILTEPTIRARALAAKRWIDRVAALCLGTLGLSLVLRG